MADKSKIIFMNTVLKNPVLGKRLIEAWDSPVGSTKRTQARDMISSIKRTVNMKMDGQGGVGADIMSGVNSFVDPFKKLLEAPDAQASTMVEKPAPSFNVTSTPAQKPGATQSFVSNLWGGLKGAAGEFASDVRGAGDLINETVSTTNKSAITEKPEYWLTPEQQKGMKDYVQYLATQGNKNLTGFSVDSAIKKPSDFGLPVELDAAVSSVENPYNTYDVQTAIGNVFKKKSDDKLAQEKKNSEIATRNQMNKMNTGQAGTFAPKPTTTAGSGTGKSIYKVGADIYDAATNTKISNTAWKDPNQWNGGKGVKEVPAPAAGTIDSVSVENKVFNTVEEATAALEPGQRAMLKSGLYVYINRGDGSVHIGKAGDNYQDPTQPAIDKTAESTIFNTADEAIAKLQPGQKAMLKNGKYVYINLDGSIHMGTAGDNYVDPNTPQTGATGATGPAALTGLIGATGMDTSLEQAEIQKLIDKGYTAEQAADYFQSQQKGASKAQRLIDMEALLEKSSGLDKLAEQKKEMVGRSGSIMTDLQDYIDGRDTYIEDADVAINNMKAELLKVSDPGTKKMIKTQLDMLYLMKGRQSQRYTDLVNTGITRLNQDMANLDSTIADAKAKYAKDLASGTAKTVEDYDRERRDLVALYNAVASVPTKLAEIKKATDEQTKTDLQIAKDAIELNKLTGETTDKTTFDKDIKAIQDAGYISHDNPDTKETFLLNDGSIASFYDTLIKQGKTPQVARQAVAMAFRNKLASLTKANDLEGITKMKDQVNNLYNQDAKKLADALGLTVDEFKQMATEDFAGIIQNGKIVIYNTVKDKGAALRSALGDLVGEGWFNTVEKPTSATQKKDWMTRWSGKIGSSMANSIWDAWTKFYPQYQADPGRITKNEASSTKKISNMTDDELAEALSTLIGSYWDGEIVTKQ